MSVPASPTDASVAYGHSTHVSHHAQTRPERRALKGSLPGRRPPGREVARMSSTIPFGANRLTMGRIQPSTRYGAAYT